MTTRNKDFYKTKEWVQFRARMIKTFEPICSLCHKDVYGSDITLDHIMPASKYPELRLEPTNMRVLCRSCNGRKKDHIETRSNFFNARYMSGYSY